MTEYPRIVEATVTSTGERHRLAQLREGGFYHRCDSVSYDWMVLSDITPAPPELNDLPEAKRISEDCITAGEETWSGGAPTPAGVRKAGREFLDKYRAYEAAARLLEAEEAEKQSEAERLQERVDNANSLLQQYELSAHSWREIKSLVAAGARLTLPQDGDA